MILAWLIAIPLAAGVLAWLAASRGPAWPRRICLAATIAELILACALWAISADTTFWITGDWPVTLDRPWIPAFGIRFHLAMDGLSLLMVLLTALLGVLAVAVSWRTITRRVGLYYLNLMAVLAGIVGVFLSADLFLFYFFWELMLVPMYFLIDIWGHERRHHAAVKFFLFTQLSGLLMLVAILALYFAHGQATREYTFDMATLLATGLSPRAATLILCGFLAAFLVKLPAVGLHTWLPDAHTEAPTAGSVVLAGLMLKTGAYGLLRVAMPLLPATGLNADRIAAAMMALGAAGIVYGAVQAFAQSDLKRLVAYTSVSHLGFVLLGAFARNELAWQGAVMQMICHGLSTGALFIIAGMLQDRLGTRDMAKMGGLWKTCPRMGAAATFFAMASLGLPGLGNFVGEFLVLLGAFKASPAIACVAAAGLVFATVYSLMILYRVFYGETGTGSVFAVQKTVPVPVSPGTAHGAEPVPVSDLRWGEVAVMLILVAALLWLGLCPQVVIDTVQARSTSDFVYRSPVFEIPSGCGYPAPCPPAASSEGGGP